MKYKKSTVNNYLSTSSFFVDIFCLMADKFDYLL